MSSSATGVGMPICFLGAILLILTQKSSQKFGDVLGILRVLMESLNIESSLLSVFFDGFSQSIKYEAPVSTTAAKAAVVIFHILAPEGTIG